MIGNLLFLNGRVKTMDRSNPTAEAIAIRDGSIVAVGTSNEARAAAAPGTEMIDLAGRTASPGLNDAHAHPMILGMSLDDLALSFPSRSRDDILTELIQRSSAKAHLPDGPLTGDELKTAVKLVRKSCKTGWF